MNSAARWVAVSATDKAKRKARELGGDARTRDEGRGDQAKSNLKTPATSDDVTPRQAPAPPSRASPGAAW
jgi:hypothetical protein